MPDAYLRVGRCAVTLELALDGILEPYQDEGRIGIAACDVQRGRHRDVHTVIATHAIDGNLHLHPHPSSTACVMAVAQRAGRKLLPDRRLFALGLEDLLAAVKAVRADVVPQVNFAGRRLERQRWIGKRVVRAVHAALRWGLLVLLYCHL
jgi:hypothetical protein